GATRVGVMGQLAPAIAEAHGLPSNDPVYVAEIDLDTAEAIAPAEEARVEALPRYPSVTRHLNPDRRDAACRFGARDDSRRGAANAGAGARIRSLSGEGRAGRPGESLGASHFPGI